MSICLCSVLSIRLCFFLAMYTYVFSTRARHSDHQPTGMSDRVNFEDGWGSFLQQPAPVPAAATAAALPPAAAIPPSIMEAHPILCPLCKVWANSPGLFLRHCKEPQHSANCLYLLREKEMLICKICNKLMLGSVHEHLVSERHARNWYKLIVEKVPFGCTAYDFLRVVKLRKRPDTPVWSDLRLDAVADKLYKDHLLMHRSHYFPDQHHTDEQVVELPGSDSDDNEEHEVEYLD